MLFGKKHAAAYDREQHAEHAQGFHIGNPGIDECGPLHSGAITTAPAARVANTNTEEGIVVQCFLIYTYRAA